MRDRRGSGFTLVEIIIVMALLGLVAAVITGVVAVVIRTTDPTASRSEESRSIRGLTTWMSQDVAAATPGPTGFDLTPSATPSCDGVQGSRLFKLSWTEASTAATEYIADYRLVTTAGVREVHRVTCSGPLGGAPFGNGISNRLTGPLGTNAPVVEAITDGVSTVGVALTVWTADSTPEPIRVEASTRNPAANLPIVPTTNTTIPSATTTPQTTVPVTTTPTTCAVTDADWDDDIDRQGGGPLSRLDDPLFMEFTVTSGCTLPMTIQFDRGDGAGVQTRSLAVGPSANLRVITLPSTNSELWTTGDKTVTVFHGSTALSPTYILDID